MRIHRDVYFPFVQAIEELHGGRRKGYVSSTAEEALKEKTAEMRAEIDMQNKKG